MILLVATNILSMFQASFLAAVTMIFFRCTHANEARESIDWKVLIVIAASLGIGNAMQITGVATAFAGTFIGLAGDYPWLALIVTYLITWVLTEMITNNAAAVLVFPFALSVSAALNVDFMPFVMTIMFARSEERRVGKESSTRSTT